MATKNVSDRVFEQVMKKLTARFGEGYDTRGLATQNLEAISTGHDDLDALLTKGARGVARGCIVEIMGSEGSGKTSMAMRVVGNAQKDGEKCIWFDTESAFSNALAEINGMDPTQCVFPCLWKPDKDDGGPGNLMNVAEVLEMMYRSVVSNVFSVVILDSVAGLIPGAVLDDKFDPNTAGIAEIARAMSRLLGKIAQAAAQTKTTVILVNQLREKPGDIWADKFHTPGGRAIKFFSHQRISVERKNGASGKVWVKDENGEDQLIGHYARCTIVKNRMAPPVPPNVSIEVPVYYVEYNPDDAKKVYDLARDLQVVTIRNGVLTWKENDDIILQVDGEADFLANLREQELEPRLAAACVVAAKDEKNLKKKQPVRITVSIEDIAAKYNPQASKPKSKGRKTSKAAPATDLDLPDEEVG